jgi:hypothetical protein
MDERKRRRLVGCGCGGSKNEGSDRRRRIRRGWSRSKNRRSDKRNGFAADRRGHGLIGCGFKNKRNNNRRRGRFPGDGGDGELIVECDWLRG